MEQFSLDKYLENPSRKVVTRDGRPVRIVCWDAQMECPIIALVSNKYNNKEIALHYHGDGTYSELMQGVVDLFFADEEELTEFEQELRYWIGQSLCNYENNGCISDNMSDSVNIYLEAASKKLLDLARKELQPEFDKELDKAYKAQDDVVYRNGYAQGKQDALKATLESLPKWKKATESKNFDNHVILFEDRDRVSLTTVIYEGEYYIELDDLKTLPKEE